MNSASEQPATDRGHCKHCGSELSLSQREQKEEFCCKGCEVVYQSIHALGLGSYYQMRGESRPPLRGDIAPLAHYRYADDPLFQSRYCTPLPDHLQRITVALEGIHCAACIWLLERMPAIVAGVHQARVRFADGQIDFIFDRSCSCAALLSEIERLGYRGKPLETDSSVPLVAASRRGNLIRIGVAAVCSLNTMMLAVSLYQGEYSGIDLPYLNLLQWYSFALTLPVILYAAVPFYRTAFGGLRAGVLHIDLPIVMALLAAFVVSSYHTLTSSPGVYFDSITTVIFLLLGARYLQSRVVERIAGQSALLAAVIPLQSRKVDALQGETAIYSGSIANGDHLRFLSGEILSADGTVVSGTGVINLAFLTGESRPISTNEGSQVYAGTKLIDGDIVIQVSAAGPATRIGKLLIDVTRSVAQRPAIELFLDRRSRVFTAVIVAGALGTGIYWSTVSMQLAIERTIAFLLVACPCVLALATPIVFSVALIQAARRGVLLRSAEVIERLERVKQVFFDKTGTLTVGEMRVQRIWGPEKKWLDAGGVSDLRGLELVAQMEQGIEHPVAFALREFIHREGLPDAAQVSEREIVSGSGIRLALQNRFVALIGSPAWAEIRMHLPADALEAIKQESLSGATLVAFVPHPEVVWLFSIADQLRSESRQVVELLRARGLSCSIVSGDLFDTTEAVARELGIASLSCHAPRSPEQKRELIAAETRRTPCLMVGDGINDAAALAAAEVGVGLVGGAESALKVADIYLGSGDLNQLVSVLQGSKRVMRSVRLSLSVSALYNVLGATAAFFGQIGPLEAAVLMPLSSLTSILVAATRRSFRD